MESTSKEYVLSLDVGTTNVRCFIYDKTATIVGRSSRPLNILRPEPQASEMDPVELWATVQEVISDSIADAKIAASSVVSMGISTQRATFIVWNSETGAYFHNFLVWQDTRGDSISNEWNDSYLMKAVRVGSKSLHTVTQQKRYLAASVLRFRTQHVSIRLLWLLKQYPKIKELAQGGKVCFATLDTWLVWKLTNEKVFVSEYSCASSTGLYDPYTLDWSDFFLNLLRIPRSMFPPILDTSDDYGECDPELFGAKIPIRCVVGDQQSAMFGQRCVNAGDVKLTMGTGAFLDVNVGANPHTSVAGFYPLIGWKIGDKIAHIAEGNSNTAGTAIDWLVSMGIIKSPEEIDQHLAECDTSGGVYFVPGFNGIHAPVNDYLACASLMGLKEETRPCHIVRAVVESLAYRNQQLFATMAAETKLRIQKVVCDGGVSVNSFLMQTTSDLISRKIYRPSHSEMSALGAAFFAGIAVGFWKEEQLQSLVQVKNVIEPTPANLQKFTREMSNWSKAVKKSLGWYK